MSDLVLNTVQRGNFASILGKLESPNLIKELFKSKSDLVQIIYVFVQNISGMMFYIPHWLWKIYEDGRLQKITSGLQGRTLDIETRKGQLDDLVKYVKGKKISNSVDFFIV